MALPEDTATVTVATVDFELRRFVDGMVNDRCGYVGNIKTAADVIERFEESTATKFTVQCCPPDFGNTDPKEKPPKIQWDIGDKDHTFLPFDGVPFMHLGTKVLQCQHGPDCSLLQKQRYAEKAKETPLKDHEPNKCETQKLDCPAKITLYEVLKFPDYKIQGVSRQRRVLKLTAVEHDIKEGLPIHQERRIYICFPPLANHSGEDNGETADNSEPFWTAKSMDTEKEIPFYPSTQFADLVNNPRSYFGYASTAGEADEVVRQYETHTSSKYVSLNDSACYGLPVNEAMKKRSYHVLFKDKASDVSPATTLPLKGVPFIMVGKRWKQCEFGKNRPKAKGHVIKRLRKSKKIGCPAKIVLRDVLVFLKHKFHPNTKSKRQIASERVREELRAGLVTGERRYYIDLPDPRSHVGHVLGEEFKILSIKKEKQLRAQEKAVMDLTFLGTASCFPTPKRGVSSTVFRHDGECWMFDCGEGTQIQLMKSKLKASRITKVFITHLHGDHLFGLPGLLCTMSQGTVESKDNQVEIYGPMGLRKYLRVSLEMSRSAFNFSYVVHELIPLQSDLPADWEVWHPDHEADDLYHPQEVGGSDIEMDPKELCWLLYEDKRISVKAAPLTHRIPCFGFVIEEKTKVGKLKAGYLKDRGVPPGPLYAKIKSGEKIVSPDGEVITPEEAVGPSVPGRKIVILGDTKDSSRIGGIAYDADILVHEATLNNELVEKCLEAGHSTPAMAAAFAHSINAKNLVLFHVSQRFKALNEAAEEGEETVELLLRQASEVGYSGQIVIAEDLDVITIQKKENVIAMETDTAATSLKT